MMLTSDRHNGATTFAERVWPVIDVYGRVRRVLGDERAANVNARTGQAAIA
jgi:hypothetical protein